MKGHPVLIELFALWCPHCRAEAPILNSIERAYAPQGLHIVSILANPYGKNYETTGSTQLATRTDLSWYAHTYGVRFPMLYDPTFATVNRYGAYSYPTLYVLDRSGVIRFVSNGETSYGSLSAAVTGISGR